MLIIRKEWWGFVPKLLAEFAIVVLGVTLALWADSWVSDRSDREDEQARLTALQENIEVTLRDLRAERENALGAAEVLRGLLSNDAIAFEQRRQQFRYGMLYGSSFFPELNVYDDLKNSGELALLTNASLRRGLARMESQLEVLLLAQADLASVQRLELDSYLLDETDLRPLFGEDVGLDWVTDEESIDFGFLSDTRFQNRVLLKLDILAWLDSCFADLDVALVDVHATILKQLNP